MTKAATTNPTPPTHDVIADAIDSAEAPWRAWGDPAGFGTLYQMGYDAWKTWADMQLSLVDACWKMGCLTFDVSPPRATPIIDDGTVADHVRLEVRVKKVANS